MLARRQLQRLARLAGVPLLAALVAGAPAAAVEVTDANVLAAILDPASFTADELRVLDLTGDGANDVLDLVEYLSRSQLPSPFAGVNFQATVSAVGEDAGTVLLEVRFEEPFTGDLNLSIAGAAAVDDDYRRPPGATVAAGETRFSVAVDGATSIQVPLAIVDDDLVGVNEVPAGGPTPAELAAEDLVVHIEDGAYERGRFTSHILTVLDNDFVWAGSLGTGAARLGLAVRMSGPANGVLVGTANGTLPGVDVPATAFALGPDRFAATFDTPAEEVMGQPVRRRFTFTSEDVLDGFVAGRYTEEWLPQGGSCPAAVDAACPPPDPAAHHLCRCIAGVFSLARPPALVSWRPELTATPE